MTNEVNELKDRIEQMKHEAELKELQTKYEEEIKKLKEEKSAYKAMAVTFLIGFGIVAFAAVQFLLN